MVVCPAGSRYLSRDNCYAGKNLVNNLAKSRRAVSISCSPFLGSSTRLKLEMVGGSLSLLIPGSSSFFPSRPRRRETKPVICNLRSTVARVRARRGASISKTTYRDPITRFAEPRIRGRSNAMRNLAISSSPPPLFPRVTRNLPEEEAHCSRFYAFF